MGRGIATIVMLILSNTLMITAWYGHLVFKMPKFITNSQGSLMLFILLSWGIAFFEYCIAVPANRIGYIDNGGPFNLMQLKIIQEVITLLVFTVFVLFFAKGETLRWNHIAAFFCLILAVFFIFYKK